jgi:hypothetical protein
MNADNKPHFISGFIYNTDGAWIDPATRMDGQAYGFNESALPEQLKDANEGHVALSLNNTANYLYTGPQSGKRTDLVVSFADPTNYNSSYTAYQIDTADTTSSAVVLISSSVAIMTIVTLALL